MQTRSSGEQNMANDEGIRSPNWNTYNGTPGTLETARATDSGSVGKLDGSAPLAAPARMKWLANGQIRCRTPVTEIAKGFIQ